MTTDVYEKYNLPNGWQWKKLGDLCEVTDRDHRTPKYVERGVPLISPRNFTEYEIDLSDLKQVEGIELDAFVKKCNPEKGDILYSRIGTIGEARLLNFDFEFVALHSIALIKPRHGYLDSRYLLYLLKTPDVRAQAKHNIKSVGTPDLGLKRIKNFDIPVAPLDQQKKIVSEIEKQFSRLDEAVANLKRVKANLKRYKAAVLKAAVEGRLVETEAEIAHREGRSFEAGAQLLQRILETRRSQWKGKGRYKEPAAPDTTDLPKLPEGWVWATVQQIASVQLGKMLDKQKHRAGKELPYLRNINVRWGAVDSTDLLKMFFKDSELDRYGLKVGDVLVCEGGEPGRASIWDGRTPGMMYQKAIHRVRFIGGYEQKLLVFYLEYLAKSGRLARWFTGSTIKHFTGESFAQLPIPLPPLNEQRRIVAEAERLVSVILAFDNQLNGSGLRAERLRQSILAGAFSDPMFSARDIPSATKKITA